MKLTNGNNGTFNVSFGCEFKSGFEIQVVTDKGAVTVTPTDVTTTTKNSSGEKEDKVEKFEYSSGVIPEILSFAQSIEAGKGDERATPQQALMDLRILQSLLESGEDNGQVKSFL